MLELTVAIAIIFIIAAVSFPSFNNYLKYQDLKNSTKNFIRHLKESQQNTVTQQIKFGVEFDLAANGYRQLKLTQPNELISDYLLSDNIFFASSTGLAANQVVFNPVGAVDQSGAIYLESAESGEQTKIIVHPSGYVTWQNN